MALGTREMLLVIRARDEASRVLGRLGTTMRNLDKDAAQAAHDAMARGGALVSLGAGITAIGGAGVALLANMTTAAGEYEHSARRALTQTGDIQVSLEDLMEVGKRVARDLPAPFEEMQDALFTIFSTIETDLPGAEKLLRTFSKTAVAGQTDLQTATQGSLQVLNGFRLGVEDVGRVSDVMFELVAEGVGTFEEFVTAIGKATPSAQRAGQTVESLAGMMAFMTRNGLSTSMSATSAARAFDLLANDKVIGRMEDMGVQVRDAAGEFRPMADVVADLAGKMQGLTAPERAKALSDLFAGSGNNVQARRFFDLAIPGFQQLNDLTGEMQGSAGAMDRAYDIMFKSPQTQVDALNNRYKIMKVEVGEHLLPVKLALMQTLAKLLGFWERLSPGMQRTIVIIAAVTSVLLVLVGIVTMLGGALLILQGTAMLFGTTLGGILIAAAPVIAVMVAIGVAVYLVIKYWDDIKRATLETWSAIRAYVMDNFGPLVSAIVSFVTTIWNTISGWWNALKAIFVEGINKIREEWNKWSELIQPAKAVFDQVVTWVVWLINLITPLISAGLKAIAWLFKVLLDPIVDGVKLVFEGIFQVIKGVMQAIRGFIQIILSIITGDWKGAWNGLKNLFIGIWNALLGAAKAILGALWALFNAIILGKILGMLRAAVSAFLSVGRAILTGLWNGIKAVFSTVISGLGGFISSIKNMFSGAGSWLVSAGKSLVTGIWNGISGAAGWLWDQIKGWASGIKDSVLGFFGIGSPSKVFAEIGKNLMLGLGVGINRGAVDAVSAAVSAATAINDAFNNKVDLASPAFSSYTDGYISGGSGGYDPRGGSGAHPGEGPMGVTVPIVINTQEINPLQHATELGHMIAETVG